MKFLTAHLWRSMRESFPSLNLCSSMIYIGVKIEELCYWQRMTSLRQLTLSLVPSCYLCECLGRTGPATWKWQLYSSVRWAQPMAPQPIWGPDRSALQSWHQYTYTGGLSTKLGRLCAKIFIDIQFNSLLPVSRYIDTTFADRGSHKKKLPTKISGHI